MEPSTAPRSEPATWTDPELVAAVNAGDTDAFATLYFRYRDWVVRQACRVTGDPHLALDVLQETFLYFLRKFPGFTLTANLKTFLYPAIRNLGIAARRKAARLHSSQSEWAELESRSALDPAGPDLEPLVEALQSLSAEHREVLRLRFIDGFKLGEIAGALALPVGTVKSRLHYALDTLRRDPRTRTCFGV